MQPTTTTTRATTETRVIAFIDGYGLRPRPHTFNLGDYRKGRQDKPTIEMKEWKAFVRQRATLAMGNREPYDASSVSTEVVLIAKTPYGKSDGDLWEQEVKWERTASKPQGEVRRIDSTQPDFDNCIKACLDAIKGIVIADDVQVRGLDGSTMIYGPKPGFRITVRPIGKVRTS